MLHLYTDRKFIPKDVEFVFDADAYFIMCKFNKSEFVEEVLDKVECAKYLDNNSFIDRFGYRVYSSCLSITSKILLDIYESPNKCINAIEIGEIGLSILSSMDTGYVHIGEAWNVLSEIMFDLRKSCELNGEVIVW